MPDQPSALTGQFRKPFKAQVAFFRGKLGNLVPTERWDDLTHADHDTAFMVAGAQKADLLTDLAAAVDRAIAEGKGLEAFRQDFRSIVEKRGWHGWTGEGSVGGEAWRTRTIYRTNARVSYAAGRFAQLQVFPLWVYRHGASEHARPIHLSWDGLVLPKEHEFWTIFYPPSDWGCSCYVVGARNERGVRRLGGDLDKKLPDDWKKIMPNGLPAGAGKGWDYAPGASVAPIVTATAEKVRHWDYQIGKAFMDDIPAGSRDDFARSYRSLPSVADDARRYAQRVWGQSEAAIEPLRTLGLVGPRQAWGLQQHLPAEQVPGALDSFDFSLAEYDVRHVMSGHGNDATERQRGQRGILPADFGMLSSVIEHPDAIEDGGLSNIGEQLVRYVKRINGETYVAVFAIRRKRRTLALKTLFVRI
ncbi:MAG: phage minor head protein [Sphingobium sp.]|nr:phage minor head protein [Sphingobium sp.]